MRRALLSLCLLGAAPALAEEQLLKLALYDFSTKSGSAELSVASNALVGAELQRTKLFKVTTTAALASLLALERQKQLLGCTDVGSSCMTEIADALGVDYLVTGVVTRPSGSVALTLSLLDAKLARSEGTQILQGATDKEVLEQVPAAVVKLIQTVAAKRSGLLKVVASEKGAAVKIDEQLRGTTPLEQLTVAGGPHLLSVEKEGFITFQREVQVQFNQVTSETVTLVPSPDYVAAYESRAKKLRLGAWISSGLTVVAAGVFTGFKLQVQALDGSPTKPDTFQFHKQKLIDGHEVEGAVDHRLEAESYKGRIETALTGSWVALGIGSVALVAALVFFIIGDDPGRYAQFR